MKLPLNAYEDNGASDCGRFLLDVSGSFGKSDVTVSASPQARPSTPEVDRLIEQSWSRQLAEAATTGKKLYDGLLARLISHQTKGRRLDLTVGAVSFKEFLGTNCLNPQVRYDHGPEVLANPLGVSAVLVAGDGFIIMGRRSQCVAIHAGMIHPIGGMVELGAEATPDPFAAMTDEIAEETALSAEQVQEITCLGLVRDKSLFQSEMVFRATSNADVRTIRQMAQQATDASEHSELLAVRDEPSSVVAFIQTNHEQATPVALAALMLHGLDRWGSGWFATAKGYLGGVI